MEYLFYNCSSLLTVPDISIWKTDNLKIMDDIFYGCKSLILLPNITKWNISKLENKQDTLSLFSSEKKENSLSNSLNYNESSQRYSNSLSINKEEKENNTFLNTFINPDSFNNNDDELNDYYENFFN